MKIKTFCAQIGAQACFNAFNHAFAKETKNSFLTETDFSELTSDIKNKYFTLSRALIINFLESCKANKVDLNKIEY